MDRSLDDDRIHQEDLAATVAVEHAPPDNRGQAAVLANLHTLGPGDSDLLAQRLRDFPELRDMILEWAMSHLGNATVHAALAQVDKGSAKEAAQAASGDDAFVAEQIDVMAAQQSDQEFVAVQMGVMAAQQEEQPSDDGAFVAEQMQEMEQAKGDEEFVAYQMGVMTEQAKDDAFVQEQLGEMEQQQRDDGFVAEQMGVMAQAQAANANDNNADAAFVEEQLGEMAKQQSDEEFARYQIGLMEAEAKAEGKQPAEAEAPKKATAEAAPEAQLVEHVAKTPDPEPELLGAALAENPELRQPLVEEATKAQGAEVVEQAVEVEQQEQADGGAIAHDEPALTAEVEAKPAVIEEDAPQAESEEAWAVRAAEYNERHAELVARFNELTESQYVGPDGSVAPDVIVAWQKANGVAVDGRIGPETVAAAKAAKRVPLAEAVQAPILEEEAAPNEDEQ